MTKKHFNTLLAVVAVVVIISSILVSQKASDDGIRSGSALIPDLKNQLSKVSGLKVQAAKEEILVELVRKVTDDGEVNWMVSNRDNYPGNFNQLKNLLTDLADAKLQEAKTKNPANYGSLGVRDITEEDSAALLLTILFDGDVKPISLLVGKSAEKWNGHYVRFPGQDQSWLTDKTIELEKEASAWLQRDIVNISSGRVKSVTYTNPKGESINVAKAAGEEDDFLIENIPAGRELSYDSVANTIASAASFVKMDDVMPEAAEGSTIAFDSEASYTSVFRTNSGLVLTANTTKVDDQAYVKFSASVDAEQVTAFNKLQKDSVAVEDSADKTAEAMEANAMEADAESSKANEDSEKNKKEEFPADQEAAQINAEVNGWVYKISNYAYGSLTKEMDDLLKKVEEGES